MAQSELVERLTAAMERGAHSRAFGSDMATWSDVAGSMQEAIEALSQPRSDAGWLPIESAPKDGSYLIAARFGDMNDLCWVREARWVTAEEYADIEGGDPKDFQGGWDCDEDEIFPTHWQSLSPPAPGELQQPPAAPEEDDPDLGKIVPGHVCKHGVRWPYPCDECDRASWEQHRQSSPSPSPDQRLVEALKGLLPTNLCGGDWESLDNERVPIVVTFGKLKEARAAIAAYEERG